MKTRTRTHILLTILLLFSLLIVSCGSKDDGKTGDETKATEPSAAAEATKAAGDEPSTGEEPTKASAGEASGAEGIFADPKESLDSYRMRTEMTLVEGEGILGEKMITEIEWVRDPEAEHSTMYGPSGDVMLETITIGNDTWTNMGGDTWMHTTATEDEESNVMAEFQTDLEDIMEEMEGGMKKDGSEKVNDVDCIRYAVDADFSLAIPVPEEAPAESLQFMPSEMEGHIEGTMWVADEGGLPEVIVRSDTRQEITLKYESREETMVYDELRDMYDINEPITIKPPEGQVQEIPAMPTMPADMPTPPASGEETQPPAESGEDSGQPSEVVTYANLNELDSYHLEWSVTVEQGGTETTMKYIVDWVKDPLAAHLTIDTFGFTQELVLIGDEVWTKAGGQWMLGGKEELESTINEVGNVMSADAEMAFVGEETVNGVKCKHYAKRVTIQSQTISMDAWVANESVLPPVVVRSMTNHQIDTETGSMTTVTEANVTAINEPITIEKPQ